MQLSVIVPAYNEEACVRDVLQGLVDYLRENKKSTEIILINDGSSDETSRLVDEICGVRIINHPYRKGYGAAIKTGVKHATGDWCATYDADGQHTPEMLDRLISKCSDEVDLIIGERQGYKGPFIRQPGKRALGLVANYLVERDIPDLNSGLRIFRRSTFMTYRHLLPDGYSLSTTSTVCWIKEGQNVVFVPVSIKKRIGKSYVRPHDFIKTLMLIMRLVMLFSPLRIFLPVSISFGGLAIGVMLHDLIKDRNVSDSVVALVSLTSLMFFFGLLADQIASIRRELGVKRYEIQD